MVKIYCLNCKKEIPNNTGLDWEFHETPFEVECPACGQKHMMYDGLMNPVPNTARKAQDVNDYEIGCPNGCGGKVSKAGTRVYANTGKHQMYRCTKCGHQFRGELLQAHDQTPENDITKTYGMRKSE